MVVSETNEALVAWDPVTGVEVARSPFGYGGVNGVAVCQFDSAHAFIAIATEDGVSWWDPATGAEPHPAEDVGTLWGVAAAATPEGGVALFGAAHAEPWPVHRWDAGSGRPQTPPGHHRCIIQEVAALALPGGLLVASGDEAGRVRRWDAVANREIGTALQVDDMGVRGLQLVRLADGRVLLAAGDREGVLHCWDALTGEGIWRRDDAHDEGVVNLCSVVVDGRVEWISSGEDFLVRRWDALSGAPLGDPLPGFCVTAWTAGDAAMIATGAVDDDDETITIRQIKPAGPV
jgi:WD40 repeat protein